MKKKRVALPPMIVMRSIHNVDLEIRERMAVEALAKGFATSFHYDTLMHMQGMLYLASTFNSDGHDRSYIKPYSDMIGDALVGVRERYEKTGKLGCTASELQTLKQFINGYYDFWVRQPITLYHTCGRLLKEHYAQRAAA